MCVSDWRLGRMIRSKQTVIAAGATSTVFQRNPQRVGIAVALTTINTSATTQYTTTFEGGFIFAIGISFPLFSMLLKDYGHIVTDQFTVACGAAGQGATVLELTLPEEILQANLDEFKRSHV